MKKQLAISSGYILSVLLFCIISHHTILAQSNPAAPDNSFDVGTGTDSVVYCTATQSDGKIVVSGNFTTFNGAPRIGLVRINNDGSSDPGFVTGTGANAAVWPITLQPNGKIIIGGAFTSYNSAARNRIARLNMDGSLDNSFVIGTGFNGYTVRTTALQSDGKILVGGDFTSYNSTTTNRIVRLNSDGSLDGSFTTGTGANNQVHSTAIQSDGKIIIGGQFTNYNGTAQKSIARLNADGSLDTGFLIGTGANGTVWTISLQSDGKIIIGGNFTTYNGLSRNGIARLNSDGTLDASFVVGSGANGTVYSTSLQSDGKVIIGGWYTTYNSTSINNIARLNIDGSLDPGFAVGTGANNYILTASVQSDGKIIFGGYFTSYNGKACNFITRLKGDPSSYNTIRGKIYTDSNNDCIKQSGEKFVPAVLVKAMPGSYYGATNPEGKYKIKVDTGVATYTLSQEYNYLNSKLLFNQCATSHSVALTSSNKDTSSFDFADSVNQCSFLNINIQNVMMRRCFRSNTFVNYCNYGNAAASNAQIKIEYPPQLVPISSTPMWTSKSGSTLTYNIGTLAPSTCGKISIIDSTICTAQNTLGLTQCFKASISPVSDCIAENPAWDKSSIKVSGSCINDSASFIIQNAGSGNMNGSHDYRIYVNDTLIFTGTFQLQSGEQFIVKYPGEGQTIRLEADQHSLHPGRSRPRASVEDCKSGLVITSRLGLVITAPQDDLDEEVSTACNIIRGSFDPNDKRALPLGIGSSNQIAPGEEIEYIIRFQNTGTDTAFTVKILDTIDTNLDMSSFLQGVSSHPYTLEVTGKGQAVLSFNFYYINLPDSNVNKAGSNGLISYRFTVPNSTPLGTVIKNKAYIYFDYNSPVLTNETIHTVGITIEEDLSKGSKVQVGNVTAEVSEKYNTTNAKIYPNPTTGFITIETSNSGNNMELRIISMVGVMQKSVRLNNSKENQVDLQGINQGMYVYELWQNGERKAGGMLQVR